MTWAPRVGETVLCKDHYHVREELRGKYVTIGKIREDAFLCNYEWPDPKGRAFISEEPHAFLPLHVLEPAFIEEAG